MIKDNIPYSLLPDLEEYGIESIERGVCEDTLENRKLLRYNRLNYQIQYDPETGQPTGNIYVVTNKMRKEAAEIRVRRRVDILSDPSDPNSDYYAGADLLLVPDVEDIVPATVLTQTRRVRDREVRDAKLARDGLAPTKLSFAAGGSYEYPIRCISYREDGLRCLNWSNGVDKPAMCRMHLGREERKPSVEEQLQTARSRLLEMTVGAVESLVEIMEDPEVPAAVKLKASTEILDRTGIRGGFEVEAKVDVTDQTSAILEKLARLAPREVEPAEVEAIEPAGGSEEAEEAEDESGTGAAVE